MAFYRITFIANRMMHKEEVYKKCKKQKVNILKIASSKVWQEKFFKIIVRPFHIYGCVATASYYFHLIWGQFTWAVKCRKEISLISFSLDFKCVWNPSEVRILLLAMSFSVSKTRMNPSLTCKCHFWRLTMLSLSVYLFTMLILLEKVIV